MPNPTDKTFIKIVEDANSVSDVIKAMKKALVGTNYEVVRTRIKALGLDVSHWTGKSRSEKIPLELQLCENSVANRVSIKKGLLRKGLLVNECAICGRPPEWESKPLTLRLDHINGINNDNRLENLRLVCPNCDSQTSTYCGRNKTSKRKKCFCGKSIARKSVRCKQCQDQVPRPTKIVWPSTDELVILSKELGYVQCGKMLGVSDNAVRRRLIKEGSLVQR